MDIKRRMELAEGFTPAEQQLAGTVLALGGRLHGLTIKELARAAHVSIPSVHRFCKKLGLEGFKELKVEVARAEEQQRRSGNVDINFPFNAGESADAVLTSMAQVYETTLTDTREVLDGVELDRAAGLLERAASIDIFTQSHNLYPAHMFCDRLLSIGSTATCFESIESQTRVALAADPTHAALVISYSGSPHGLRRDAARRATQPGPQRVPARERQGEPAKPHHPVRQPYCRAICARLAFLLPLRAGLRCELRIPGTGTSRNGPSRPPRHRAQPQRISQRDAQSPAIVSTCYFTIS